MNLISTTVNRALRSTREALQRLFTDEEGLDVRGETPVTLRRIEAGDAERILGIYDAMGAESRYQRFNTVTTGSISSDFLVGLSRQTEHDALTNGVGFLAFAHPAEGQPICIGKIRYVLLDEHAAEFSISVIDDYQSLGVGTALMRRLIAEAERQHIDLLMAYIRPDNGPMIRVIYKLGIPFEEVNEIDMLQMSLFLDTSTLGLI